MFVFISLKVWTVLKHTIIVVYLDSFVHYIVQTPLEIEFLHLKATDSLERSDLRDIFFSILFEMSVYDY